MTRLGAPMYMCACRTQPPLEISHLWCRALGCLRLRLGCLCKGERNRHRICLTFGAELGAFLVCAWSVVSISDVVIRRVLPLVPSFGLSSSVTHFQLILLVPFSAKPHQKSAFIQINIYAHLFLPFHSLVKFLVWTGILPMPLNDFHIIIHLVFILEFLFIFFLVFILEFVLVFILAFLLILILEVVLIFIFIVLFVPISPDLNHVG